MCWLNQLTHLIRFIGVSVTTTLIAACQPNPSTYASVELLKQIDKHMAQDFVQGEWRYYGARAVDEGIAVYIQIPERTDFTDKQFEDYIIQTICPKTENLEFWRLLTRYDLYIRTYNYVERNYSQAKCPKPFI